MAVGVQEFLDQVGSLAREYRPSMDAEVLHDWSKDAQAKLVVLEKMVQNVLDKADEIEAEGKGTTVEVVTRAFAAEFRSAVGEGL